MPDNKRVVVASRHVPVITWLQRHYPELADHAEYLPQVRRHQVDSNTILIGSWPLHLLSSCGEYWTIEFEQRPMTVELSADQMEEHGAYLKRYTLLDDEQLVNLALLVIEAQQKGAFTGDNIRDVVVGLAKAAR